MPDTPHYHISKGDWSSAVESLKFMRGGGKNDDIMKEIDEIKASVEESLSHRSRFIDIFKGKANVLGNSISQLPRISEYEIIFL